MIIIHKDAGLADPMAKAYWNEVSRDRRLSIRETRYALGLDPPNYPVPAIPLEVEYDVRPKPVFVAIWNELHCVRCYYKPQGHRA